MSWVFERCTSQLNWVFERCTSQLNLVFDCFYCGITQIRSSNGVLSNKCCSNNDRCQKSNLKRKKYIGFYFLQTRHDRRQKNYVKYLDTILLIPRTHCCRDQIVIPTTSYIVLYYDVYSVFVNKAMFYEAK